MSNTIPNNPSQRHITPCMLAGPRCHNGVQHFLNIRTARPHGCRQRAPITCMGRDCGFKFLIMIFMSSTPLLQCPALLFSSLTHNAAGPVTCTHREKAGPDPDSDRCAQAANKREKEASMSCWYQCVKKKCRKVRQNASFRDRPSHTHPTPSPHLTLLHQPGS